MTAPQPVRRLPVPAGALTSICECSHDWIYHGESGWTSRSAACHGWTGSATPGPYEPCRCTGFKAWNGLRDARTGEPVKPLTVAVDARIERTYEQGRRDERAAMLGLIEQLAEMLRGAL